MIINVEEEDITASFALFANTSLWYVHECCNTQMDGTGVVAIEYVSKFARYRTECYVRFSRKFITFVAMAKTAKNSKFDLSVC